MNGHKVLACTFMCLVLGLGAVALAFFLIYNAVSSIEPGDPSGPDGAMTPHVQQVSLNHPGGELG